MKRVIYGNIFHDSYTFQYLDSLLSREEDVVSTAFQVLFDISCLLLIFVRFYFYRRIFYPQEKKKKNNNNQKIG